MDYSNKRRGEILKEAVLNTNRRRGAETICYCGHVVAEHEPRCYRLGCDCPEFVDSLEAASYLSGHHPTTCTCDSCEKTRAALRNIYGDQAL